MWSGVRKFFVIFHDIDTFERHVPVLKLINYFGKCAKLSDAHCI